MGKLNIVVIGSGVAGLCSAKYALQSGHLVTVYEQTSSVGGQWAYTDKTGVDEYGIPIHTSMYHGLRTNLPKEVMALNEYSMQAVSRESYIGSEEVLEYLRGYANHFNVTERIKFRHQVIRVRPVQETKWEIIVKDLLHDEISTHIYDAIFVCNGRNSNPSYPNPPYPGTNVFRGRQIHSHDYRRAEQFRGKTVLVIGAGPSGVDLTHLISETAKRVYFSHHTHHYTRIYPSNVVRIDSVKELTETGVVFADGSQHEVDEIVYCTGYKCSFPFLSADCGLYVDRNCIQPLFKYIFNINQPTMAFIGLPYTSAVAQMVDIQVRFALKFLNGEKSLPSAADMKADSEIYAEVRRTAKLPVRKVYTLAGPLQRAYYDDLSTAADIENVHKVYTKMFEDCHARRFVAPNEYRNDIYHIIDDEHFEKTTVGGI